VALVVGAPRPIVEAWIEGTRVPSPEAEGRIAAVYAAVSALTWSEMSPARVVAWLTNRQPALGGARPVHVLAQGGLDRVLAAALDASHAAAAAA
jgi:hypothetical protein